MSFVICKKCRYVAYCTFPPSGTVRECDEYEEQDDAPSFDWDLRELMERWSKDAQEPPNRTEH